MSLINCPECGKEISDKVKACPHCGFPFEENNPDAPQSQPQQVELTAVNLNRQINWKPILLAILLILIGLATFFIVKQVQNAKAEKEYQLAFNNYADNLLLLQLATIGGGSKAEELTNLTARVWANSIYEDKDPTTDKFTRNNNGKGGFYDDFNIALGNLLSDSSTLSTIREIEQFQTSVKSIMEDLQDPPVGMENCYQTATELYTAFKSFTNLAINPTGSLTTFNDDRNSKSSALLDAYNKLETQIPDKFDIPDDEDLIN
jgi:hypothetical protein